MLDEAQWEIASKSVQLAWLARQRNTCEASFAEWTDWPLQPDFRNRAPSWALKRLWAEDLISSDLVAHSLES